MTYLDIFNRWLRCFPSCKVPFSISFVVAAIYKRSFQELGRTPISEVTRLCSRTFSRLFGEVRAWGLWRSAPVQWLEQDLIGMFRRLGTSSAPPTGLRLSTSSRSSQCLLTWHSTVTGGLGLIGFVRSITLLSQEDLPSPATGPLCHEESTTASGFVSYSSRLRRCLLEWHLLSLPGGRVLTRRLWLRWDWSTWLLECSLGGFLSLQSFPLVTGSTSPMLLRVCLHRSRRSTLSTFSGILQGFGLEQLDPIIELGWRAVSRMRSSIP